MSKLRKNVNEFIRDCEGKPAKISTEEVSDMISKLYGMSKEKDARIASLESQLKEKEEHYRKLEVVANRWHNEYLNLQSEKDKEIERLKDTVKDRDYERFHRDAYFEEIREALREVLDYAVATGHRINYELEARCRKLIE